ncbi:MAG: argonaute PAZ domain-containing protein [Microcoleaceae cyanobacterium]
MNQRCEIYLNSFPVCSLDEQARTVNVYKYSFEQQPEGTEIYKAVNHILYNIGGIVGAKLGSQIVTLQPIAEKYLQGENWTLQHLEKQKQILNPKSSVDRKTLEQLYRRDIYLSLRRINQIKVEKSQTGLILWDKSTVEQAGEGWQVLKGALVDIAIDENGQLNLEIDSHYRFYSPWTVHQWLEKYPDLPINYVRNLDNKWSWYFVEVTQERPENIPIPNLGKSLAEYHRDKGVSEQIIQESCVVYVRHTKKYNKQKDPTPHLSKLLKPSVSMEILSYVAEKGDRGAAEILTKVRLPIQERLEKGKAIAKSLLKNVYKKEEENPEPIQRIATLFPQPTFIAHNNIIVKRPNDSIKKGCFRVGETQFGCLNLKQNNGGWPDLIKQQLLKTAQASGTKIDLTYQCSGDELPDKDIARRRFWSTISDNNIKTMLVVSDLLGIDYKMQLRREALQAGIALQFMRPMPKPDPYRAANITLGLLVKAGWQPIGIKMPDDPNVAELTIGFDAGTNGSLFYGTSAFAVLATGQSIGWEIPEAQVGERFSQQAIYQATLNIVQRFYNLNSRNPKRVLLLRDGFVQDLEFGYTINWLEKEENIPVDLLEVHKSGAGRMAQRTEAGTFHEVASGTGFSIAEDAFRIVTSKAQAGGSARPLEVVRIHGDASLEILAHQIFALSEFHPASAFASSRLPMPLHYADKMIKEVQRLGQLGILHGIDNQKIFAA